MGLVKHCLSKIYQPITAIPKNAAGRNTEGLSKSQKLMLELGIIQQANPGCFNYLPLGIKSLEKLTKLVDKEMMKINGQKVMFPTLVNEQLWKTSGRLKEATELFKLKDRHEHNYLLSPTHEETVTDLLSINAMSYKNFPLRLYQITSKFRDEMKPRFGLIRGREFIMKDMYSFDINEDKAMESYELICEQYNNFFMKIGIPFVKVRGDSGMMGGQISHEFHFVTNIGEDKIFTCEKCSFTANLEVAQSCPNCKLEGTIQNGIEVGHTFYLGDKYSKPLKAYYLSKQGKPEVLKMGSYGLGLSRILAAGIEVLSTENEMRWPDILSPYNVIIIPPKAGSKEEQNSQNLTTNLYKEINNLEGLENNVLLDDRTSFTIGKRFLDAKRVGYRFIIVINQKTVSSEALYELNDLKKEQQLHLQFNDLLAYLKENTLHLN